MYINLLTETETVLKGYGKSLDDIIWFGTEAEEFSNNLVEFLNKHYDAGFGGQEISPDLVLVGKDFWLERHEYDGSEWWEYKQYPKRPTKLIAGKL